MAASTQETAPHSRTLDYGRSSSMIRRKAAAKGDLAKLIWCFIGVVGTLIIYGIGQERIMKFPYGDRDEDSEYFQHSLFIVLCNRLMTCAVAVIAHLVTGASLALVAPIYAYGAVSLSNVISSGCQYEALKYVSFPLQTIAKSSRMVPVLIWGTLISRKQYKPREYIIAITIILGSCLFFLNVTARTSVKSTFSGLLLMLGYLGFDGFTNTFQDKLFEGYDMPAANQVLYITLCSSVISLLGLRQDLSAAIAFIMRHPDCAVHIAVLSVAATISQFFISYTIKTFGALTFATIMTTRQLLSIVLSSTIYGPPLSSTQQVGTVVVFGALYYKSWYAVTRAAAASQSASATSSSTIGTSSNSSSSSSSSNLLATTNPGSNTTPTSASTLSHSSYGGIEMSGGASGGKDQEKLGVAITPPSRDLISPSSGSLFRVIKNRLSGGGGSGIREEESPLMGGRDGEGGSGVGSSDKL
ncbi:unnamed protein product [Closterium sp. Yama58-4]|nr:unnamed protein product [Closterium sp. Yama58-4]